MKYSLDTNVCIRYMHGRSAPLVRKLKTVPADEIGVSIVVRVELHCGVSKRADPTRTFRQHQEFLRP